MKLPHSLRIIIFFLRIALGLNFFYLGFTSLFNPTLETELGKRSLGSLYAWIASPASAGALHPLLQWGLIIIGICLIFGLLTRFMALLAIGTMLANYLPNMTVSGLSATEFINDELIVMLCLLIVVFSNAGAYLGIDTFIHVHLAGKHAKK